VSHLPVTLNRLPGIHRVLFAVEQSMDNGKSMENSKRKTVNGENQ